LAKGEGDIDSEGEETATADNNTVTDDQGSLELEETTN